MNSKQQVAMGLLGLVLVTGDPAIAADGSQCTDIADSTARLSCYDAALKAHPKTAATPSTLPGPATPESQAVVPQSTKGAPSTFGLPPQPVQQDRAAKRLDATVVSLQKAGVGQVFTLDNGQVWQIPEYLPEPFVRVHDAVIIKKATLGSFLMVRASGGNSVYVKRLQ